MGLLVYVMELEGRSEAADASSKLRKTLTAVASCIAGPGGTGPLPAATSRSEVTFTGKTTFEEAGAVAFGAGNELRFRTIGEGRLFPTGDPSVKIGWATCRVEGGFGEFEGATGIIRSNFVVEESGDITDSHFATIFVK